MLSSKWRGRYIFNNCQGRNAKQSICMTFWFLFFIVSISYEFCLSPCGLCSWSLSVDAIAMPLFSFYSEKKKKRKKKEWEELMLVFVFVLRVECRHSTCIRATHSHRQTHAQTHIVHSLGSRQRIDTNWKWHICQSQYMALRSMNRLCVRCACHRSKWHFSKLSKATRELIWQQFSPIAWLSVSIQESMLHESMNTKVIAHTVHNSMCEAPFDFIYSIFRWNWFEIQLTTLQKVENRVRDSCFHKAQVRVNMYAAQPNELVENASKSRSMDNPDHNLYAVQWIIVYSVHFIDFSGWCEICKLTKFCILCMDCSPYIIDNPNAREQN